GLAGRQGKLVLLKNTNDLLSNLGIRNPNCLQILQVNTFSKTHLGFVDVIVIQVPKDSVKFWQVPRLRRISCESTKGPVWIEVEFLFVQHAGIENQLYRPLLPKRAGSDQRLSRAGFRNWLEVDDIPVAAVNLGVRGDIFWHKTLPGNDCIQSSEARSMHNT